MKKLWGGVFKGGADELADQFGQSIESDLNFWQEDVEGSIAHARMLGQTGIIPTADAGRLVDALKQILAEGPDALDHDAEDIHAAVEARLFELVPESAGRLHTARSRNDQVATDVRLYLCRQLDLVAADIKELQKVLAASAEAHLNDVMPGWTHGQRAQPLTLGLWLLAHFWALQRHGFRLEQVRELSRFSPLGSGALAGTNFPIDRFATSKELGFRAPIPNALDATSDRSSVLDALHVLALIMLDLSRISQELILFTGVEFGFVALDDGVTTGSSIMPQKRNPDMAELIRGRTSRVVSNWTALATLMKGLVLGYNRDTQDDKPPLFESIRLCRTSLRLVALMLDGATWNTERMAKACHGDFSTATDLANFLVARGCAFREAHEIVGGVVRACIDRGLVLEDLTKSLLAEIDARVPMEALTVLNPKDSVRSRESYGGPGPKALAVQLKQAKSALADPGFLVYLTDQSRP